MEQLKKDEHGNLTIGATAFMAYHSMMRSSRDYYEAIRMARVIADNLTEHMNLMVNKSDESVRYEVFPYRSV